MSLTSPDIRNYFIGKGNVFFKKDGDAEFRHMGNVPEFEFTPALETIEHFSSMEGVRSKDRTDTLSKSATLRIVAEEWTMENLAMALLSDVEMDSAGDEVLEIFSKTKISGAVKLVGSNDIGARFEWNLNRVEFIPGSSLSPIGDEYGRIEITGNCSTVLGSFGKVRKIQNEGGAPDPSA